VTTNERTINDGQPGVISDVLDMVPQGVAETFFHGLDDVRNGRTVSVAEVLSEGRRRIAHHRGANSKSRANDPAVLDRESSIP
jgi:hypothetical protein